MPPCHVRMRPPIARTRAPHAGGALSYSTCRGVSLAAGTGSNHHFRRVLAGPGRTSQGVRRCRWPSSICLGQRRRSRDGGCHALTRMPCRCYCYAGLAHRWGTGTKGVDAVGPRRPRAGGRPLCRRAAGHLATLEPCTRRELSRHRRRGARTGVGAPFSLVSGCRSAASCCNGGPSCTVGLAPRIGPRPIEHLWWHF